MKKILSIFIVLLIGIVAFCGCNEKGAYENNNGEDTPPQGLYVLTLFKR